VDPVPDSLRFGKSGRAENRTRSSGSVARNSETTEAVRKIMKEEKMLNLSFARDTHYIECIQYHLMGKDNV
jgi:hypothetical protein